MTLAQRYALLTYKQRLYLWMWLPRSSGVTRHNINALLIHLGV